MPQTLLSLPYDVRHQIWQLVVGRSDFKPCRCIVKPYYCTVTHPNSCFGDFKTQEECDHRILRVCRQIHDEVRPLTLRSPKVFTVCNGLCLNSLFLSVPMSERRHWRRFKVRLYIGKIKEKDLRGLSGHALLKYAESWCGPYVQTALKCQGVSEMESAELEGDISVDEGSRRTAWVYIQLKKGPEL